MPALEENPLLEAVEPQVQASTDNAAKEIMQLPPKSETSRLLDQCVEKPVELELGEPQIKDDIPSSIGPFHILPEHKTLYPPAVVSALCNLYAEYNRAFDPLLKANQEWETDHQFCFGPDGTPLNRWVQIDMVGLPPEFLEAAHDMNEEDLRETLKGRIFEIENSLAMYGLMENIFDQRGVSAFKKQFFASLAELRETHNRPVALLAVTEQKYQAMKSSEFGKRPEQDLTDREVKELSGFDKFFGPQEFEEYLAQNSGQCDFLIYARTSDPVVKLKNPGAQVNMPLMEDPYTRRIIKANAVTFNVDNPHWPAGDPKRINDTKRYLLSMGMAHGLHNVEDAWTIETFKTPKGLRHNPLKDFATSQNILPASDNVLPNSNNGQNGHKGDNRWTTNIHLNPNLAQYLYSQGIAPDLVESGQLALRAKPMQGAYGCYGHLIVNAKDSKDRQELKRNLRDRGPYVAQPELKIPRMIDKLTGQAYTFIDRVFFATNGQLTKFMSGFRSMMPVNTVEAEKGRNHGSIHTVWSEICSPRSTEK